MSIIAVGALVNGIQNPKDVCLCEASTNTSLNVILICIAVALCKDICRFFNTQAFFDGTYIVMNIPVLPD